MLHGTWEPERLLLRTADQLDPLGLDLRLGTRATGLDAATRTLTLDGGERLTCAGVIIATGVAARSLPGAEHLAGVHTLRTLDDALALRARLTGAERRLVIVGNGVLGCEAAAVARELGHEVTLVGRDPVPMARALGAEVGTLLAEEHRAHGVRLLTADVAGFDTAALRRGGGRTGHRRAAEPTGRVSPPTACCSPSARTPPCSGCDDPALDTADGLRCDAYCAAAPGIYAAGDVARWDHPVHGRPLRFEHRTNATEQGMAAARNLLAELAAETVPAEPSDPAADGPGTAAPPVRPRAVLLVRPVRHQDPGVRADRGRRPGRRPPSWTTAHAAPSPSTASDGTATGIVATGLPPRQVRALRAVIATPLPWEEARERVGAATG